MKPLHTALYALLLISSVSLNAQNLISNPGFESHAQTVHYKQVAGQFDPATFASGWYTPTNGSPDLFRDDDNNVSSACGNIYDTGTGGDNPDAHACYPEICTHENFVGSQTPRVHTAQEPANDHFVGFGCTTEYIQTSFSPLQGGTCYYLSFWVSRADLKESAWRVQAVLSKTSMASSTMGLMAYTSDAIVLTPKKFIESKTDWTLVEFYFTASGGEKYLTFGIFDIYGTPNPQNPNVNDPISFIDPGEPADCDPINNPCQTSCQNIMTNGGYYYLDDVTLIPQLPSFSNPTSFFNQTISGGTYTGNILLTGLITISGTVTFDAATVKCNGSVIINVPVGATLRIINNSNLSAGCSYMWNGIVCYGHIEITNSSIRDAIVALDLKNGSTWQIFHSNFTANADDIVFTNAGASSYITGTTFDHTVPLQDPAYGTNGFGTTAITINPQSNSATDVIGGNAFGDGCTFLGGVYGIKSSDHNLKVEQCTFDGIQQYGIYFLGIGAYPINTIRNLEVKSCHFTNNKFDVTSSINTNLIVTGSDFFNSLIAILWAGNSNCNLWVGRNSNTGQGNVFKAIRFSAIECWNNKCTQYQTPYVVPLSSNLVISENQIVGGTTVNCHRGIGISEFTLGGLPTYRTCDISNNTITDIRNGIELYQIRGWGGLVAAPPAPVTILNNRISLTTLFDPNAKGIVMKNSPGFSIAANSISSNEPYSWQNVGIYLENSQHSDVVGNVLGTGTGISYFLDGLNDKIHCNSFTGNSCGINMAGGALRNIDIPHGEQVSPGNYIAYNNYFTGAIVPWTVEFNSYYTNVTLNRWVWDNTVSTGYPQVFDGVTGAFITNMGTSSFLSPIIPSISSQPLIGTDDCDYEPVHGENVFNPDPVGVDNPERTIVDPTLEWTAKYNYQIVKNSGGPGNSGYASQNIKRIIRIEDALTRRDYNLAIAQLSGFVPDNLIEQNYQQVLTIQLAMATNEREATVAEKNLLIQLANQSPWSGGPAVEMARAYLFHSDFMIFDDEDLTGPKIHGTAFVSSPCCIAPASGTVLTFADQLGNELPIPGATVQPDGSFAFDPFQIRYYSSQNPATTYRIKEKQPSRYTVLNKDFHTLQDWIGLSPIAVTLGGVVKIYDTIIPTADTVIVATKIAADASGNIIYVDSTASTDFVVKKKDAQGNMIWMQDFSGLMTGADSATSLAVGQDNSVYIAGSKNNNGHSDFVIAKLDSTGFIEWHHITEDTTGGNSIPTAIGACNSGQTICAIGIYSSANGTSCKKVKYTQCISSSNLRIQNQPNVESSPMVNPISVYPNPSAGGLTVVVPPYQTAKMELISTTGQVVCTRNCEGVCYVELDQNQVADGVYLIKFTLADGSQFVERLIVRRTE